MREVVELSDQERELLVILAEECGEVVQAVAKMFRHGPDSSHPSRPEGSNLLDLETELGHVREIVRRLEVLGLVRGARISFEADRKSVSLEQYLHGELLG